MVDKMTLKIRLLQETIIKGLRYDYGHEFEYSERKEDFLNDNFVKFEIIGAQSPLEQWNFDKKIKGAEAYKDWEFIPQKTAKGFVYKNEAVDQHFKQFKNPPKRKESK